MADNEYIILLLSGSATRLKLPTQGVYPFVLGLATPLTLGNKIPKARQQHLHFV